MNLGSGSKSGSLEHIFGSLGGRLGLIFFFQAEDGIRDLYVTGVQTCALPILAFDQEARDRLIGFADGDARRLLNAVEILSNTGRESIDGAFVEQTLAQNLRRFDKGGEQFYDQISALHKSVRGSDADAALYWLVRMLDGGADPLYVGRRIVRMAVEDIGLADPRSLRLCLDACETYERLGSPEGELALAEA